tara:strand:+ start:1169 stop:2206 length:1038 start_codon:yes stop_codon:yes gene_type:complete
MNSIIILILALIIFSLSSVILWFYLRQKSSTSQLDLNEIKAQLQIIASTGSQGQKNISDTMTNSMTKLTELLSNRLNDQTKQTTSELTEMQKRLAVIDSAQKNLSDLTKQVTGLQNILSNNQARGSFGEAQLENIINDMLPNSSYEFQYKLSNNKRVDCIVKLPGPPGNVCIDSKFPLESWRSFSASNNNDEKKFFLKKLAQDVEKHIKDISDKYIVPGETAETALMFIPSESIYSGINLYLPESVEFSRKKRVLMVGPDNIMYILNTVRSLMKDVRMSEKAGIIQVEVSKIMDDVERLDKRVNNLNTHFNNAQSDIDAIQTSSRKIISRGQKIEEIEVEKIESD